MKYERPELTALPPAINAIQVGKTVIPDQLDDITHYEPNSAYADWE